MSRKDILAAGGKRIVIGGPSSGTGPMDFGELGRKAFEVTEANDQTPETPVVVEAPAKPKTIKKFTPLGDVILVRRAAVEGNIYADQAEAMKDTSKKIVVVQEETNQEVPAEGMVLAVGPGLPDAPMTVKVGDYIEFGKYAGAEFKLNGEKMLLMRIGEVLGILSEEYLN